MTRHASIVKRTPSEASGEKKTIGHKRALSPSAGKSITAPSDHAAKKQQLMASEMGLHDLFGRAKIVAKEREAKRKKAAERLARRVTESKRRNDAVTKAMDSDAGDIRVDAERDTAVKQFMDKVFAEAREADGIEQGVHVRMAAARRISARIINVLTKTVLPDARSRRLVSVPEKNLDKEGLVATVRHREVTDAIRCYLTHVSRDFAGVDLLGRFDKALNQLWTAHQEARTREHEKAEMRRALVTLREEVADLDERDRKHELSEAERVTFLVKTIELATKDKNALKAKKEAKQLAIQHAQEELAETKEALPTMEKALADMQRDAVKEAQRQIDVLKEEHEEAREAVKKAKEALDKSEHHAHATEMEAAEKQLYKAKKALEQATSALADESTDERLKEVDEKREAVTEAKHAVHDAKSVVEEGKEAFKEQTKDLDHKRTLVRQAKRRLVAAEARLHHVPKRIEELEARIAKKKALIEGGVPEQIVNGKKKTKRVPSLPERIANGKTRLEELVLALAHTKSVLHKAQTKLNKIKEQENAMQE